MNDDLLREVFETAAKFRKVHMVRFDHGGLSKGEHMVLMNIRHQEESPGQGVQASQLSDIQHISRPAISQMVRTLEEKGMVERQPDATDRRVVWIRTTKKGNRVISMAEAKFEQFVKELVERLGEEDTRTLIRLMGKLTDMIDDMRREGRLGAAPRCDGMR